MLEKWRDVRLVVEEEPTYTSLMPSLCSKSYPVPKHFIIKLARVKMKSSANAVFRLVEHRARP